MAAANTPIQDKVENNPKKGIDYYFTYDWLTIGMAAMGIFVIIAFGIWFKQWMKKKYT